eukprot:TRINITY_DN6919_c0_g1_i9.p1 TRINITY_DN6919_c0_g1~~TRINITY_DN6919_c0_g1_i9.p1  ORF type:complete len:434 (+),score=60.05 TRINITY_DN6919_c0_g1_i9:471-1772(+)
MMKPVFDRFLHLLFKKSSPLRPPKPANAQINITIQPTTKVIEIISQEQLEELIFTKGAVIVDFWSPMCGPCTALKPVFRQLAETNTCSEIAFCAVNINSRQEIGAVFKIKSVPLLMFYHKGSLIGSVKGNLPEKLQEEYNKLKKLLEPTHPHTELSYKVFAPLKKKFVLNDSLKQKRYMMKAIRQVIGARLDKLLVNNLAEWIEKDSFDSADTCNEKVIDEIFLIMRDIALTERLPFVDLMRIIALWHEIACLYLLKKHMNCITELIITPLLKAMDKNSKNEMSLLSYMLKVIANALTHTGIEKWLNESKEFLKTVLKLADNGLNSKNSQVIYSAIIALHNLMLTDIEKTFNSKMKLELAQNIAKAIKGVELGVYILYWAEITLARVIYCLEGKSLDAIKSDTILKESIKRGQSSDNENVKGISEDVMNMIWN